MSEHRYLDRTTSLGRSIALFGAVLMLVMVSFFMTHSDATQISGAAMETAQLDDRAGQDSGLSGLHTGAHCQSGSACVIGNPWIFALSEPFVINDPLLAYVPDWISLSQLNELFRPPRLQA